MTMFDENDVVRISLAPVNTQASESMARKLEEAKKFLGTKYVLHKANLLTKPEKPYGSPPERIEEVAATVIVPEVFRTKRYNVA